MTSHTYGCTPSTTPRCPGSTLLSSLHSTLMPLRSLLEKTFLPHFGPIVGSKMAHAFSSLLALLVAQIGSIGAPNGPNLSQVAWEHFLIKVVHALVDPWCTHFGPSWNRPKLASCSLEPCAHWYRGLGIRFGNFEVWKSQKSGVCSRTRCPWKWISSLVKSWFGATQCGLCGFSAILGCFFSVCLKHIVGFEGETSIIGAREASRL